jgi:hypothetical protein
MFTDDFEKESARIDDLFKALVTKSDEVDESTNLFPQTNADFVNCRRRNITSPNLLRTRRSPAEIDEILSSRNRYR